MKVLHLTLKKKWFDMIASGEKKEEYRDEKEYWIKRLFVNHREYFELKKNRVGSFQFTHIMFSLGYQKQRPQLLIESPKIFFGAGKQEWGAESNKEYFVIKLGDILSIITPSSDANKVHNTGDK